MAIKPFNSVGGISVGESPITIILANGDITTSNANLSANLYVTNTANVGNLRTDNLLYANGNPWDFQEAAGANTQIQYNLGNNFAASANFTYDDSIQNLVILGNANVTQTFFGNVANFSGNITSLNANLGNLATANYVNVSSNITVTNLVANTNVDFTSASNVTLGPVGNIHITGGTPDQILKTDGNGNLSWSSGTSLANGFSNVSIPTANGNVLISANAGTDKQWIFGTDGLLTAPGNIFVSNSTPTNGILTDNLYYANGQPWDLQEAAGSNTQIQYNDGNNDFGASANFTFDYSTNLLTVNGNAQFNNANLGNLATANFIDISSNTLTSNLTVNLELSGNTANFSGNVIVPNLTVNLELSGNTANFTGNLTAANLIGALANGNSDIKIYQNANVEVTIGGTANVATFSSAGLFVAGDVNSTTGNITSNGSVTANGFLYGANANVTGQAILGSVLTANITAPTGDITISAAGSNQNIILSPTGAGNVDVGLHNITQVGTPVNPNDAATKEYVDNISQGLYIHPSANVTTTTNLTATYLNGGIPLTATTISGGTTITFSANHGLVVDADIEFTNSFNGIIAGEGYFVFSIPAPNQITIKDGYFGTQITTLTNATGLTEPALGEAGVGATLTNAGAQAALTIDSVLMTVGARVLVQGQTNQTENGIYDVTTVGTGSTNWVLTRSSDGNSYAPKSDTQLGSGSYFFVTQGTTAAGTSYVLTNPPGEIHFGTSNITFAQFGASGGYTAGNGIYINGTIISANVDLETTAIVAGNITVKVGANLTTPNIGDATFSSLSWNTLSNGNVTANNLSLGNIANIGSNLTVGGLIEANGNISSNANINGNNAFFTNVLDVGGNLLANNITSNHAFSTNTANISSNLVTSNATVNLELSGNTANFSGNVIVPNLTVNLELAGNTANFTGNIVALNTNAGNILTANFANIASNTTTSNLTVNLQLDGNTANFSGNITSLNANLGNLATANYFTGTFINGSSNVAIPVANGNINLTAGGNTSLVVTNTGANITGNLGVSGNFSVGSLQSDNLTANLSVFIGNTTISWGTVTTNTINANQTISSFSVTGVTGVEFLVKGIDTTGSKYSVATVTAVTDGSNVDFSTFGTVNLGGQTGSFNVNVVSGNLALQVTPASTNSTMWTTQVRFI